MEYIGSYIVYFLILILSVICGFRTERSETENEERKFRTLLFFVLWIPAFLRQDIGTDYPHYVLIYDFIDEADNIEIGFKVICKFLHWLGADSFWLFAVISALTYIPFCFGFPREWMLGGTFMFVVAFYLFSFSGIRQALAVSLLLYGTVVLLKGEGKKFLVLVFIATLFHRSAWLVFPLYFIKEQAKKPIVVICLCGIAVLLMSSANIIERLFNNPIFLASSYGQYAENSFSQETEMGTGLGVLSRMMLPILTLFLVKQLSNSNEEEAKGTAVTEEMEETDDCEYTNTGFISLICIAYVVASYLATRVHIFNRLGDLFRFVPILCMGLLSARLDFYGKKPVMICFIILYTILFLLDMIACVMSVGFGGGLGIMPYQTIFDDMF